jgi:hypothetical protein
MNNQFDIESYEDREKSMQIFSAKGSKVSVTKNTANNGMPSDKELVRKLLKIDEVYSVLHTCVGRSSSTVVLQEFPNVHFNTVNFVNVGDDFEIDLDQVALFNTQYK